MNENSVTKPIVFKINTLSKLRSPIMKGSHNKVAISHKKTKMQLVDISTSQDTH